MPGPGRRTAFSNSRKKGNEVKVNTLLLIMFTFTFVSCARTQKDGGQDGGGGNVLGSTAADVHRAVDVAISILTNPDVERNLTVKFWDEYGNPGDNVAEYSYHPNLYIFPDLYRNPDGDYQQVRERAHRSPALQALAQNEKIYVAGDCPEPAQKHADASVSSFDTHGTICISEGHLMRLDPRNLLANVVALMLHEAVHLGGGDEREAEHLQQRMADFFAEFYGDLDTKGVVERSKAGILRLTLVTKHNSAFLNDTPKTLIEIGELYQINKDLPYIEDPIALQVALKVTDTQKINDYMAASSSFRDHIRVTLFGTVEKDFPITVPTSMTSEDFQALMADLSDVAQVIDHNFSALVDESAQSQCVSDWHFRLLGKGTHASPRAKTIETPCSPGHGWPEKIQ